MSVRVLSWNVCDENKRSAKDIAQFICECNADIICLQEVAPSLYKDLLSLLSGIYEHHHVAHDMRREGKEPCALVFLSRLPVIRARAVHARAKRGFRSFFTFFSGLFFGLKEEHIEFQKIDIQTSNGRMRIMNAHLEVGTSPQNRLNQFKYVLRRCKRRGAIKNALIVGDLNIFGEEFLVRFAGIFSHGFGIKWLWLDEREEFEKICKKRHLKNIFKRQATFSKAGYNFQLDHILVPEGTTILWQKVLEDMCGSDHGLIVADIDDM